MVFLTESMAPPHRNIHNIRKYMDEKGFNHIPIMLIPMREYGLVKGQEILNLALKTMQENN